MVQGFKTLQDHIILWIHMIHMMNIYIHIDTYRYISIHIDIHIYTYCILRFYVFYCFSLFHRTHLQLKTWLSANLGLKHRTSVPPGARLAKLVGSGLHRHLAGWSLRRSETDSTRPVAHFRIMKFPRKIDKLISDEISVYKLYVSYYFNGYFMLVPSLAPITGTGRGGPVHLLRHSARLKSVKDLEEWNSIDFPCGLVEHR